MRRILIGVAVLLLTTAAVTFMAGAPVASKAGRTASVFYSTLNYKAGHSAFGYANVGIGQLYCTASPYGSADFKIALDNLPDGAQLTKVSVWYWDFDATYDLTFGVGRASVGVMDSVDEFPGATSTTGVFGNDPNVVPPLQVVEMTPTSTVVLDNSTYQYFISATFGACGTFVGEEGSQFPGLVLDGARVDYTIR